MLGTVGVSFHKMINICIHFMLSIYKKYTCTEFSSALEEISFVIFCRKKQTMKGLNPYMVTLKQQNLTLWQWIRSSWNAAFMDV
jgi:hypothetical protein